MECQSWFCCLHRETLASNALSGPQPVGLTQILQRQVGHTMIKPLQIYAGTQTRGCAQDAFKTSWQVALPRASVHPCWEPGTPATGSISPALSRARSSLHSLRTSRISPSFSQGLPVKRTGTRDQIPHSWRKRGEEGQGMKGSGAPSPGGQSEGRVRAEEHIQYQWPWIYLETTFLILSQMLPSVTLTLSEKLGQEMGREGRKEAQNQHKNRNIKVSFSRQTSRDGGLGGEEENKSGKCDGVRRGKGKGRPLRGGAQGTAQGQK